MPENPVNIAVGKKIKAKRLSLGLSQEALGTMVGIASQQVQKYEKGMNALNITRLLEFAQALNSTTAYFLEGLDKVMEASPVELSHVAEDTVEFEGEFKAATDRETLEIIKSFKNIQDHLLRKRFADLLRAISLKQI